MRYSTKVAFTLFICGSCVGTIQPRAAFAQDTLPDDNGLVDYHKSPEWRETEGHPLRVAAYILHPIGWLAREVVFRPLSYLASSTEQTRSVSGYRHPYDYRRADCFSTDAAVTDCKTVAPFNYDDESIYGRHNKQRFDSMNDGSLGAAEVVFPHVNFDFGKHTLNAQGRERVAEIASMIKSDMPDEGIKLLIEGHTDDIGTEKYNMTLGKHRAESVKAELVKQGVGEGRLTTVSLGEVKPLIGEKNRSARKSNRRVEVVVK
jgi:outer membrane protein OmpA-like peptidoglycan-associated protein